MGYAYLQQEKLEDAIEEYKGAIELRPNYVVALNNLGDAYKKSKKYEESLEAYRKSLAADPGNKVRDFSDKNSIYYSFLYSLP